MHYKKVVGGFWFLLFLGSFCAAQTVKTEVEQINGQWTFIRDGKPYYVKGAGGHKHLEELVECGGNSIRTWSLDDAQEILDNAQEHGLTVMMGLWVGHERHGFDYNDEVAVARQLQRFREAIPKFKDHPALLCWGVGNEVDLFYSNTKVWDAVQDIAKMIHELDPNHPTTTVTAGLDSMEVQLVKAKCPDIDVYSVNTYGDIASVPEKISGFGWEGPYMITEWGPNGHWEVSKTTWGAPIEQTSEEKAQTYRKRYLESIEAYKSHCIGSYVFLWGQKQETTATWYGVFSDEGEWTAAIDQLQTVWSGTPPSNKAPQVKEFWLDDKELGTTNVEVSTEAMYTAKLDVVDPEHGRLRYNWYILPESTDIKAGGDKESKPTPVLGLKTRKKGNEFRFETPKKEGAYRLFVSVQDSEKKVAYANFPFYAKPGKQSQSPGIQLKQQHLELD